MRRPATNAVITNPLHALACAVLLIPGIVHADVFKCVNNDQISYSSSPCKTGNVPYDRARSSLAESRTTSITLLRDAAGGFSLPGSVNGVGTNFTVDTGATFTTLSGDYAYKLGVHDCIPVGISRTANGETPTCRIRVSSLSFGGFNYSNITVYINPTMRGVTLLGNDLLSGFRIHHEHDVMVLSR